MSDTLVAPGSDPGPPPSDTPSGGGISSWPKGKKIAVFGGAFAVLALGAYLYARSKKSSTPATSTTGTDSTTPTLVLPSSNQDAEASSDYASLEAGLGNLSTQLAGLKDTGTAGPPGKTGPSGPAGPPGGGTTDTTPVPYFSVAGPGGQTLDVLGGVPADAKKAGLFGGYNIKGGAPVYADVPGSNKWVLGLKGADLKPGTVLATPSAYWGDVVPGKVTNEQLP